MGTKEVKIQEYHSFTEILHQHQIPYCMDSGVLLGLMRDGKMLAHEKDIDLQMWSEHKDQFISIIPQLTSMGWKVTIWKYKGLIYQFRVQRPGKIPVHIMVFRRDGDWAWCPAGRATGNPFHTRFGKYLYAGFVVARRKLRNVLTATDVAHWPWKARRDLATWWLPAVFFADPIYNEQHQVYIPNQWDDYLAFRYGNWQVPAEKWDFWHDDGAIKHNPPEELLNFSRYSS